VRWQPWILYLGLLVFLLSALAVLRALEEGSLTLAWAGAGGMAVAGVLFVASMFIRPRRVDWNRIRAEQRLWESGPLGRSWLRVRRRLSRLWKL
jgi:hypothetical protein